MNFNNLKDETLVLLYQKKKADVLFILYARHKKKCGAIVYHALSSTSYVKALMEESDYITIKALKKSMDTFDASKGKAFSCYLGQIVFNMTINRIREYSKEPLSNFLSMDTHSNNKDVSLADSLAFADSSLPPNERVNINECIDSINEVWKDNKNKRIKKMILLKESGYSCKEIAKKLKLSEKSVRSTLYRVQKIIRKEITHKLK